MVAARRRRGLLIPLFLVVLLLVAAVDVFPVRQLISQNRERQVVEARLAEIQAENAQLEREIEALHSPSAIERIARADFGYVRPGEVSYVVFEPPEEGTEESGMVETATVPVPESGGFWEAVWDYVTGRDVVVE